MKLCNKKHGYALVTVMGIMAVMAITFTMLMKTGQQGVFTGKLLKDRTKASAYAEAGIEFAYSILRDDYDNRTNAAAFWSNTNQPYTAGATLTTPIGEGSFTLNLIEKNGGQYIIINSEGTCGNSSVDVEAFIEDTLWPDPSETNALKAYDYGIFAGGSDSTKPSKFGGNGLVGSNIALDAYFAGDLTVKGGVEVGINLISQTEITTVGGGTVSGTLTAPIVNGTATSTTYIPPVTIPPLDFVSLYNDAYDSNNTSGDGYYDYYDTGGAALEITQSMIYGGIIYVDGDVLITSDITATVIATGNIRIMGGSVIADPKYGIAAATGNGKITDNSTDDHWGLFYSQTGNFVQGASNGKIEGQIMVGGIVEKTGGKALYFELTVPEDIFISNSPEIAAWQK